MSKYGALSEKCLVVRLINMRPTKSPVGAYQIERVKEVTRITVTFTTTTYSSSSRCVCRAKWFSAGVVQAPEIPRKRQ